MLCIVIAYTLVSSIGKIPMLLRLTKCLALGKRHPSCANSSKKLAAQYQQCWLSSCQPSSHDSCWVASDQHKLARRRDQDSKNRSTKPRGQKNPDSTSLALFNSRSKETRRSTKPNARQLQDPLRSKSRLDSTSANLMLVDISTMQVYNSEKHCAYLSS